MVWLVIHTKARAEEEANSKYPWTAPVIDWKPLIAYFVAIGGEDEEVQTLEQQADVMTQRKLHS